MNPPRAIDANLPVSERPSTGSQLSCAQANTSFSLARCQWHKKLTWSLATTVNKCEPTTKYVGTRGLVGRPAHNVGRPAHNVPAHNVNSP